MEGPNQWIIWVKITPPLHSRWQFGGRHINKKLQRLQKYADRSFLAIEPSWPIVITVQFDKKHVTNYGIVSIFAHLLCTVYLQV